MEPCPAAETVDDFVAGRLPPDHRRQLEVHLDACATCQQLVARLMRSTYEPSAPRPDRAAVTVPVRDPLAIGEGVKVGRYIVLGSVGAGGMGTVYAAYDRALDRKIALKFLARARSDEAALAQMLAEASAMARLSHPNVVTVHDVGAYEGKPYLAMEFVEGTTLEGWRRQQPRSMREIARVMAAVARGLGAAHAAGIIHRDVKPQNVLVAGSRVLVTDFGLSVRDQGASSGGVIAGTPAYMAPEQFRGDAVDARTDVFGLCATLYEMIHGCPPFGSTTPEEVRERLSTGRPPTPPPGSRASPRLHRLALRGLAPDPNDRPASMDALADELLADPAVSWRRGGIAVLAAGAAAAAFWVGGYLKANPERQCRAGAEAMTATFNPDLRQKLRARYLDAGAGGSWSRVERRFEDYVSSWRAMHDQTCAATYGERRQSETILDLRMDCLYGQRSTIAAMAQSLLTATPTQLIKSTTARLPIVAECEALGRAGTKPLPPDPQARAGIRSVEDRLGQADAQIALGDLEAAGRFNQQAVTGARQVGYEPLLARALRQSAAIDMRLGRGGAHQSGERAVATLMEAMAAADAGRDDLRRADVVNDLVADNVFSDRYPDAERWAGPASALLTRIGDPPAQRSGLEHSLGWLWFFTGKRPQAEAAFDRSLSLRRSILKPHDPLVLSSLNGACTARPTLDSQTSCFRDLVAAGEATYGPRHYELASLYNNLAICLVKRPRTLPEGCAMIRKAVDIKQASIDAAHPALLDDLNNLAWCLNEQGNLKEARSLFEKALTHAAPKTAARARLQDGYGLLLADDRDPAGALRNLRQSVADRVSLFGATHHLVLETTVDLGKVLLGQGRAQEALTEVDNLLAACKTAAVKAALVVELHNLRGRALQALGKFQAAHAAHEEALRLHEELNANPGAAPVATRPPEVAQSEALQGLGVAELSLGRFEPAFEHLERALSLRKPGEMAPELRAETALTLARALMDRAPAKRSRACSLGQEAVAGFQAAGPRSRDQLRQAQAWVTRQSCQTS